MAKDDIEEGNQSTDGRADVAVAQRAALQHPGGPPRDEPDYADCGTANHSPGSYCSCGVFKHSGQGSDCGKEHASDAD
jgi:hypothetical protein